jgi:hydroxyacylglutathione hydrolase
MHDISQPGSSGPLRFQVLPSGRICCNASVLWHEVSRDAVVIDPTDDARTVVEFVKRNGLRVRQILLTHAHFDHAADTDRAINELECPAWLHPDDLPLYSEIPWQGAMFGFKLEPASLPVSELKHGQQFDPFPDHSIRVLHVPGHSPGSVAFYLATPRWAFVGDTLFNGGVGRTDLPGGSSQQLVTSIQTQLYVLPDDTLAVPGHGPSTTIGDEKRTNPFVRADKLGSMAL